jgi:hypothetical protein
MQLDETANMSQSITGLYEIGVCTFVPLGKNLLCEPLVAREKVVNFIKLLNAF